MPHPRRFGRLLENIYENVTNPASFSSPEKLYKEAKKQNSNIKRKDVNDWLEGNRAYTLHRKSNRKFRRRPVLVRGPNFQYQADLMDYQPLAKENNGNRYLLTVIDCFSRFASIIPVKNKTATVVANGLKKAFKFMGHPQKLQTDLGKEFYNSVVKQFLEENKIHHFSTDQELKAQICERFNRTVREKLKKYMTAKKSLRYIDALPGLIQNYNSAPHSSLGGTYAPKDVNKNNKSVVFKNLYGDYLREKSRRHKYNEGDTVRLATYSGTIGRKDRSNFTDEVFTIAQTLNTNPPTYRIIDPQDNEIIKGSFYEPQLQRYKLHAE